VSLEALKRRLGSKADAAALPPTAPAPPTAAGQAMLDEAAAGGAAAAEQPADSFAVDVEHDSETGGDDTPTRSVTLNLSLPAAATADAHSVSRAADRPPHAGLAPVELSHAGDPAALPHATPAPPCCSDSPLYDVAR
jgi:hypothetical protein